MNELNVEILTHNSTMSPVGPRVWMRFIAITAMNFLWNKWSAKFNNSKLVVH